MKLYVLTKDLEIGYVSHLCTCKECKQRGNAELTVNYLDGSFMFHTTLKAVLLRDEVIAFSNDIDELRKLKLIMQESNSYLCRYLENELFKSGKEVAWI